MHVAKACRFLAIVGACCLATPGRAQLYQQNFQVDSSATWTVNKGPATTDEAHNFFFDYSTVGIPAAPSAPGTRGMKLQANQSSGVFGGMSVSPTGLSFAGEYVLAFDWWGNFNGPFPVGGSGSTHLSTFGVGTAGVVAQWPGAGPGIDSVWFAVTADGNSAADWRVYSTAAPTSYPDASTIYAAVGMGNRNHSHAYYAMFGNVGAPAAQLFLFPQQTGLTLVGSSGMEWHKVRIVKDGARIVWFVDGLRIASIVTNTVTLGGGNIFFGHSDTNATSSTDPNDVSLLFTLIDNVKVTRLGDLNGDGSVNVTDLLALISAWGPCPAPPVECPADLNSSGTVNVIDLLELIGNWE